MRTLLLANNRLGAEIGRYLMDRGELAGLVVHPEHARKHGPAFSRLTVPVWTWPVPATEVASLDVECALSVLFNYRLSAEWLALPSWRALNLHPALLPWNRGNAPNAWPLVDGSPAGVTLHVMEPTIDTGPVMCQQAVPTYPDDTAHSLYLRLEAASLAMFTEVWPTISGREPRPQPPGGSSHRMADLAALDLTDDDLTVVDRIRARTFPPYGAEFERDGRRYRVRVVIEPVE